MFELAGFITALFAIVALLVAALVTIAAPIAWVWMLIDAILREDADYPGESANSRLLWVLLLVLLPISAIAYFFLVYAKMKRGASAAGGTYAPAVEPTPAAPQAPVSAAG